MSQSERPVLVAPDSFKGTFTALQVATAVATGLGIAGVRADVCPVADGGEGTAEVLREAYGGARLHVGVHDPLGRPITAEYFLAGGVAFLDTAQSSGLNLVPEADRDPIAASTFGTGELIAAAAAHARTIYLGVGGSATTDGGAGALLAISEAGGLRDTRLMVLCDVRTPFEDAARVFGPQKGASPGQVDQLAAQLNDLAPTLPRDPRGQVMTGAAGGLAGGLWAALGAELVPGAHFVLDAVRFRERAAAARCVVTGEGRIDGQSAAGKLISAVAEQSESAGVSCHAVCGQTQLTAGGAAALGLATVTVASELRELTAAGEHLGERLQRDGNQAPSQVV